MKVPLGIRPSQDRRQASWLIVCGHQRPDKAFHHFLDAAFAEKDFQLFAFDATDYAFAKRRMDNAVADVELAPASWCGDFACLAFDLKRLLG